jgi:hypothetical protein
MTAGPQPITAEAVALLRKITQPRTQQFDVEQCEMCAESISSEHSHVASLAERRLLCSCRACYLLFTQEGAGARRLRAIPDRYSKLPEFAISDAQWDLLSIPVNVVFFFNQSQPVDPADAAADRVDAAVGSVATVACYPSPAGATESMLDLELWQQILADNNVRSALPEVEADVEALLVRRFEALDGAGHTDCYLVPIDACYELVGLVRQHWIGFAGGAEVWQHIDRFFDRVAARCPSRAAPS